MQEMAHPTVTIDAIQLHSFVDIGKYCSSSTSRGDAGELHPRAVPTQKAPPEFRRL